MRVEQQQNTNILDTLQQSIGPEERETGISFVQKAAEKVAESCNGKSVNVKDATYLKPQAKEQKSAAEKVEESAVMDATERKNQMAVLANTTSEEDYARMQEDGFSLDSTTTNTIVTETDKIKAQLAKAGVDISIFGDDLDMEQLEAIAGSEAVAAQIAAALKEADLPATTENIKDAVETVKMAEALHTPDAGEIKYLVDNGLEPTVENLYRAEFSGSGSYRQGMGDSIDAEALAGQFAKVIEQAGLTVNEETMADCQWMLENDMALTAENLQYFEALKQCKLPVDTQTLLTEIASAVAGGGRPQDAQLLEGTSLAQQAVHAMDVVAQATDEDLAYIIDHGMDLNLRNLENAIASRGENSQTTSAESQSVEASEGEAYTAKGLALITARRQLEEVRLMMTVEANYSLLKKGISIDTEPLTALVEELKANENAYYENLLKSLDVEATEENVALFRETTEKFAELRSVPAYVLGMSEAEEGDVNVVHAAGTALKDTFEKANERYETLMTAPRADLGDSIQKAFQNVDTILEDIGVDVTEANRRAARILGYNELEITPESIARMKAVDEEVQRAFGNMTPAVVTQMIKRNINPLDMDFETLNDTAEQIAAETGERDTEKFAEYLWKLEKNGDISEDERNSYVGIYRLIHQVNQTDGAAIGALVNQGAELTMRNLLTAVRSERRSGKMDYAVDSSFEISENGGYGGTSITDQIETAYQSNRLKDALDILTPEKLRAMMQETPEWEQMTPEQFAETLEQVQTGEEELNYAYAKERLAQLNQSANVAEDIYSVLEKYDIPNTMANVLAMESMVKNSNQMYRKIFGDGVKSPEEEVGIEDIEKIKEELIKEFGEAVSTPKEMAEAQEKLGELAENVMKTMIESDEVTSLDVREMRMLSAQLSINSLMTKEEQYSVPVLVSDGVVNVSLKIVRGTEKKGIVDIMMESELRGKIAATFQAKEKGISGLVATDNAATQELLEENRDGLLQILGEEGTDLHVACISDLDLNHFSMGMFGVKAEGEASAASPETAGYEAQTSRLYHIAESFIRVIRESM